MIFFVIIRILWRVLWIIMGLLTTKSCCFCLSVRTGGLAWECLFVLNGIPMTFELIHKRIPFFMPQTRTKNVLTISEAYAFSSVSIILLIGKFIFFSQILHWVRTDWLVILKRYSIFSNHFIRIDYVVVRHFKKKIIMGVGICNLPLHCVWRSHFLLHRIYWITFYRLMV